MHLSLQRLAIDACVGVKAYGVMVGLLTHPHFTLGGGQIGRAFGQPLLSERIHIESHHAGKFRARNCRPARGAF